MDLGLAGRHAIVTGGSRGIGRAIAHALLTEGARVAIAARDPEVLKTAAASLTSGTGGTVLPVVTDTGDDDSVRALVARVVAEFGGVDILVNNAARPGGATSPNGIADLATAAVAEDFNVKALGYLRTAQAAAPHFIAQRWGRIINIGGLSARQVGLASASVRNISVAALTKTLADELGPHGITANVVHPGLTTTDGYDGTVTPDAAILAASATRTAIRRVVTADEVAALVTFLASPLAGAITGESIAAGGGTPGPIHY